MGESQDLSGSPDFSLPDSQTHTGSATPWPPSRIGKRTSGMGRNAESLLDGEQEVVIRLSARDGLELKPRKGLPQALQGLLGAGLVHP